MRTILRLCLVGALVASVGLAAVPIADAQKARASHHVDAKQNKKIKKARRKAKRAHARIEALKQWNFDQDSANGSQQDQIDELEGSVAGILAGATDLIDGLLALQAALEDDVAPALEAIDAALNDETTGLVGLNLVRPQFAALAGDATFLGGTGAAGGSGPEDDSDTFQGANLTGVGGPDMEGFYVVDFNNDVSSRMYTVNVFPYGPGMTAPTASATNCASSAGASDLCGTIIDPTGPDDTSPNHVVIQIGDGTTPATSGFSITAISG